MFGIAVLYGIWSGVETGSVYDAVNVSVCDEVIESVRCWSVVVGYDNVLDEN